MNYAKICSPSKIPQSEPLDSHQVLNNAGGFVFKIDPWSHLDRFLILGSENGTFYVSENKLTRDNANIVKQCLSLDFDKTISKIAEISSQNRAPKNDPAIFSLALAFQEHKHIPNDIVLKIIRTGTHLFTFTSYLKELGGLGRGKRKALSAWYNNKNIDDLTYQLIKYRNRMGFTHKDVLSLCHFYSNGLEKNNIIKWAVKGSNHPDVSISHPLLKDFVNIQSSSLFDSINIISNNHSLTWEMLPTELLKSPRIWKALLPNIPYIAMIRNLGRMTSNETISPLSDEELLVSNKISNDNLISNSKIHPIQILAALETYKLGHGVKGSLSWNPSQKIIDSLNNAFYKSLNNISPSSLKTLIALDVSGSMFQSNISNIPGLTAATAATAMAMVVAKSRHHYHIVGFQDNIVNLNISPNKRLDDNLNVIRKLPFGNTDCAKPMLYAIQNNLKIDTFIIYTDNETWCGKIHPIVALKNYRKHSNINSKLIVVAMTSTDFSIADPIDHGMLDVVGFDSSVPQLIDEFEKSF